MPLDQSSINTEFKQKEGFFNSFDPKVNKKIITTMGKSRDYYLSIREKTQSLCSQEREKLVQWTVVVFFICSIIVV